MSTCNFSHLIFDRDAKNILEERKNLQQMVLGKLAVLMSRNEVRPIAITCTKLTPNGLNVKHATLDLAEENTGSTYRTPEENTGSAYRI